MGRAKAFNSIVLSRPPCQLSLELELELGQIIPRK
jgi:hypothetical protein